MKVEDFTEQAEVLAIIKQLQQQLKSAPENKKWISDIIDEEGNQYVDLVMEGGGALGIALLGYIYVLEQAGIRFLQLGGTSVGSVTTLLLAAAGPVNQLKSPWLIDKIANKKLSEFIDADADARDFIKTLLSKPNLLNLILKGIQIKDNLHNDFGLNLGKAFHDWITTLLQEKGVRTYADLKQIRSILPSGLRNRLTNTPLKPDSFARIALVAADITTQTKVVFPEMASLYYHNPDTTVNLADYVRASVSVPLFFEPFKVKNIPNDALARQLWENLVDYNGDIPEEVYFIDGGIMSNFPIDLFHNYYKIPDAPTFGVKLGIDRNAANKITKFSQFLLAVVNSAWQVHDFDFILKNPDYKQLVCWIDTGSHNWLNLNVSEAEQIDLFVRGACTAADFLKGFDWEGYKKLRASSMQVYMQAQELVLNKDTSQN